MAASRRQDTIRFVPEDPSHRIRVLFGSQALVGVASHAFSLAARSGNRRLIHAMERWWARSAARLLRLRLDIEGENNIDSSQRYVLLSLHEGLADAIALIHLGLPLKFLVRDELFEWPALSRYLSATGQIRVDENPTRTGLRAMYRAIEDAVGGGDNLVVFPQGSVLGVEVAFRQGVFRIARRLGVPVLPVVVTGSHRVWEHPYSATVRLDQEVSVRVLSPLGPDELDARTVRVLERSMKRLALDPSTASARRFDPDRDGWWDDYRYEVDPDFEDLARRLALRRANLGKTDGGADAVNPSPRRPHARRRRDP